MATPGQLMFARGLSPQTRLIFWVAVSLSLAFADARYDALNLLRSAFSQLLSPMQRAAFVPFDVVTEVNGFLVRHRALQQQHDKLVAERVSLARELYEARDALRANAELRSLLQLTRTQDRAAIAAQILYQRPDWFSRRVSIDRGSTSGVRAGSPVIDAQGLVGQVTRVYPQSSEVTLVNSSDQLTPVYVERTGQRALAAGGSEAEQVELQFMPTHADIKPGDMLLTSGIDKVYPPGLPVARVLRVTPLPASPYARVECLPLAGVSRDRALLVLSLAPVASKP